MQFPAGRPEHTMVHLGGNARNGGKQLLEWGIVCHIKDLPGFSHDHKIDELAGDAVESFIRFDDSLLLICRQPG